MAMGKTTIVRNQDRGAAEEGDVEREGDLHSDQLPRHQARELARKSLEVRRWVLGKMTKGPRRPGREHQDVSAAVAGPDARRKRNVRSVSRIAVKPTMTLTQVRVSFMPTLKATSAERDALPRRM